MNSANSRLQRYQSGPDFLRVCSTFLCEHEAENNLILGVAGGLGTAASHYSDFYLVTVGESAPEGAFMMTPPHKLLLSSPASARAMQLVIEDLLASGRGVPGIHGRADIAARFAELWRRQTREHAELSMKLLCYQLTAVQDVSRASGGMRTATPDDLDLLVEWTQGFNRDAKVNFHEDVASLRRKLKPEIEAGLFYLWEDGEPVSMTMTSSTTPSGVRISLVYTPREYRGRGYASSLVAEVSALNLRAGKRFCFLYTDAANPTSNKIYGRIGYQKVGDFHEYTFTRP